MSKKWRLAVIGTDSLRGKEIKKVLSEKRFPHESIDFFDPDVEEEYSKLTQFQGEPKVIKHLNRESLLHSDLVFLAADKKVNREFGSLASKQKFQAIDMSETFNKEEQIPVVVAGVNDDIILKRMPAIIANPHPVTIILSHLFHAILEGFEIVKAISFILQPVSAFEESGIVELANQSYALLSSSSLSKKVFKEQIAFNLFSPTERTDKDGFSSLEKQIISEIKRVLANNVFPHSLSVIQAPVFHTYSIMSFLELNRETNVQALTSLFRKNPFFEFSPPKLSCPATVAGKEEIFIGQIKKEKSFPNSFYFWTVADNLTTGSALNAIEIARKITSGPLP